MILCFFLAGKDDAYEEEVEEDERFLSFPEEEDVSAAVATEDMEADPDTRK